MEIISAILFLILLAVIINYFRNRKKQDRQPNLDSKFTRKRYSSQAFVEKPPEPGSGDLVLDVEASPDSTWEAQGETRFPEKFNKTEDNSSSAVNTIPEEREEGTNDLEDQEPKEKEVFASLGLDSMVSSTEIDEEKLTQDEPFDQTTADKLNDVKQNDTANTVVFDEPTDEPESRNPDDVNKSDKEGIEDLDRVKSLSKKELPDLATNTNLDVKSKPRVYKPPVLKPVSKTSTGSSAKYQPSNGSQNEYQFSVAVRIYFQRGGFVDLSFLLGRNLEIPDLLDATWFGQEIHLLSLTDDWFESVSPLNIGELLEKGFEVKTQTDDGRLLRWSLSGRSLYVLTASNTLSGFISTTRLTIGKEYTVLCKQEMLQSVKEVIQQTESPAPEIFNSEYGLPKGWVCLRNILPRKPIDQTEGQDILNILRPLNDIKVELDGGLRIENSIWLYGYSPKISVQGSLSTADRILIDGMDAIRGVEGGYTAPGWDQPGNHTIWVAGQNKSYTIRDLANDWEIWQARLYPGVRWDGHVKAICGPVVMNDDCTRETSYPIIVPATNAVVIGTRPGEILRFKAKLGKTSIAYGDFTPFEPIWALPSNPYQADRLMVGVLLVGSHLPPYDIRNFAAQSPSEKQMIWEWSNIILAASRKGLNVLPNSPETYKLWNRYKNQAKAIWKKLR
jgi:hypothetical protein